MISATVNALVRGSRKNAANCDTHCEVRNSENRQDFERILYTEATRRTSGSVFVAFVFRLYHLRTVEGVVRYRLFRLGERFCVSRADSMKLVMYISYFFTMVHAANDARGFLFSA